MRRRKITIQAKTLSRRFDSGGSIPFLPTSISGCGLWLDGADSSSSSMILSGSNVTTWKDKSGNGRNGTAVETTPIIASGGGITFSAGVYNTSYSSSLTNESLFIVFRYTRTSGTLGLVGQTGNGARLLALGAGVSTARIETSLYNVEFGSVSPYSTVPINTIGIGGLITTNSTMDVFYNGTSVGSPTTVTFTPGSTSVIGGASNAGGINTSQYFAGIIYEVIGFTTVLSTIQRQKIEGYLAHKWGLQTSLPTGHRYKTAAPTGATITFVPNFIPGNQLWLDGADSTSNSMVLSGSSVTSWKDKSGNGYHMNTLTSPASAWTLTSSAEYPTIGTSINQKSTVRFSPQAGLKQATTLDGVKNFFWVGRIAAPTGGSGNYFLLGHDTEYDWHASGYGYQFVATGYGSAGVTNASPTSLFTSDANAVTNTTFSSVLMPSAPNVSLLSAAGITGNTRYQGICYDRNIHIGWCGDLAEVVIFNSALSTIDRQEVEGYLAHKWGLQSTLPAGHPYKTTAPSG